MNEDKLQTIHNGIAQSASGHKHIEKWTRSLCCVAYSIYAVQSICIHIIRIYQRKSQLFSKRTFVNLGVESSVRTHTHTHMHASGQIFFFLSLGRASSSSSSYCRQSVYLFWFFPSCSQHHHHRRRRCCAPVRWSPFVVFDVSVVFWFISFD